MDDAGAEDVEQRTRALDISASPPTMIDSVPVAGPDVAPLTGASRVQRGGAAAISRLSAGDTVLMSTISESAVRPGEYSSRTGDDLAHGPVVGQHRDHDRRLRATAAGSPRPGPE